MDFQIGDVVNRTFGTISRNFVVFFLLSMVLVGLPTFVFGLGQLSLAEGDVGAFATVTALAFIVNIVAAYVLQGALIHAAIVDFNGGRASLSDSIATGIKHFLPLIAIAILMSLGLMVGMMLLVVPGVILAIMWVLAVPVQVVEKTGIRQAFARSRELTRGSRWKIFGLFIVYIILATVLSMIIMLPAGLFAEGSIGGTTITLVLFQVISSVLTAVVSAAGVSALYFELRKSKEGIGAEALAKVFD